MNLKRGLFLLWIVASLLWYAVAIPSSVLDARTTREQTRWPTEAEISECRLKGQDPFCDAGWIVEVAVWNLPPRPTLAGILLAPLTVLLFGLGGLWVFRGFSAAP